MPWRNHAQRRRAVAQPSAVEPRVEFVLADDLAQWRAEWDALVLSSSVPSPFLRSWWLAEVAKQPPTYVLVIEGGALIGGLSLEAPRRFFGVPIYRFAGSGVLCPDHLDMVARADRTDVVAAMVTEWFNRPGSRLIDLQGVVEHSVLPDVLSPCEDSLLDGAPWEVLAAGSADGYLATRSANFRRSARRSARKLADAGVRHRCVTGDVLQPALEAFRDLQELTPGREALLAEFPRLRGRRRGRGFGRGACGRARERRLHHCGLHQFRGGGPAQPVPDRAFVGSSIQQCRHGPSPGRDRGRRCAGLRGGGHAPRTRVLQDFVREPTAPGHQSPSRPGPGC